MDDTIKLMQRLHAGQVDLSGAPYYLHPLSVMQRIPRATEYEQHLALLHDIIEDTGISPGNLRALGYPAELVEDILLLSRHDGDAYIIYINRIAASARKSAIRVKIADLEDNGDPVRLAKLDVPKSESLQRRYAEALTILRASLYKGGEPDGPD